MDFAEESYLDLSRIGSVKVYGQTICAAPILSRRAAGGAVAINSTAARASGLSARFAMGLGSRFAPYRMRPD
jgi:hypothetical protein